MFKKLNRNIKNINRNNKIKLLETLMSKIKKHMYGINEEKD